MNRKAGGMDLIIIIFLLEGDKSKDPEEKDQNECSGNPKDYLRQWNPIPKKNNLFLFDEQPQRNA